MSLFRLWLVELALVCQADDVVTLIREPLLLASNDTGCILERKKVDYMCHKEFTPQLLGISWHFLVPKKTPSPQRWQQQQGAHCKIY